MDANTAAVIVAGIFALVIIIAFWRYRQRGGAKVKGPFGISFETEGSNATPTESTGISATGVRSREGEVVMEESSGGGIRANKVDARGNVTLSSGNLVQRNTTSGVDSLQSSGALSAQSLQAGGNITIQQFVTSQASLAQQLQFFAAQLGIRDSQDINFSNSQFKAYSDVWKSLQALRLAGDELWSEASRENLLNFAEQLRQTTSLVREGEIFFEEDDRENLLSVLRGFANFRIGKERLIETRSRRQLESYPKKYMDEEISEQIAFNHKYKTDYEKILDDIRVSFRRRLAGR